MANPIGRYIGLVVVLLLSLHLLLFVSHTRYSELTSERIKDMKEKFLGAGDPRRPWADVGSDVSDVSVGKGTYANETLAGVHREKAAIVVLARNSDLWEVLKSMRHMEDRFNRKFGYPYIFLNEQEFSEEFIKYTQALTDAPCQYGLIPAEQWNQPDSIDEDRATKAREKMIEKQVIYGHSVPYRNMCRFNSGFFYRQELLKDLDYYWRLEPSIEFFCDLDEDPFKIMRENKYKYAFTISLYEYQETIETLWQTTKDFMKKYPELIPKENALSFISDDGGETYNRCHFWSNFEIADLKLWRSEAYTKYFEYLDEAGGFYYERWGDAPVHSIAAALFSSPKELHHFNEIGYRHNPFQHCPQGEKFVGRCSCNPSDNFDYEGYSCLERYDRLFT